MYDPNNTRPLTADDQALYDKILALADQVMEAVEKGKITLTYSRIVDGYLFIWSGNLDEPEDRIYLRVGHGTISQVTKLDTRETFDNSSHAFESEFGVDAADAMQQWLAGTEQK